MSRYESSLRKGAGCFATNGTDFVNDGTDWTWVPIRWLNTGELVAVDGEQAEESRPGLSSREVAGSGPVAPPGGADRERNTGADDPCLEARLGGGVPVR